MNAKNKFRGVGLGAVKREKFTDLLKNLKKETEENEKKQQIAEHARVNPSNFRYMENPWIKLNSKVL